MEQKQIYDKINYQRYHKIWNLIYNVVPYSVMDKIYSQNKKLLANRIFIEIYAKVSKDIKENMVSQDLEIEETTQKKYIDINDQAKYEDLQNMLARGDL